MISAVSVPAGSTADVPLDFEASQHALVIVVAEDIGSGVSATFAGASLDTADLLPIPPPRRRGDSRSRIGRFQYPLKLVERQSWSPVLAPAPPEALTRRPS